MKLPDFDKSEKKEYDSDDDDFEDDDLYAKFQRKIYKNHIVCLPDYEQKVNVSKVIFEIFLTFKFFFRARTFRRCRSKLFSTSYVGWCRPIWTYDRSSHARPFAGGFTSAAEIRRYGDWFALEFGASTAAKHPIRTTPGGICS